MEAQGSVRMGAPISRAVTIDAKWGQRQSADRALRRLSQRAVSLSILANIPFLPFCVDSIKKSSQSGPNSSAGSSTKTITVNVKPGLPKKYPVSQSRYEEICITARGEDFRAS